MRPRLLSASAAIAMVALVTALLGGAYAATAPSKSVQGCVKRHGGALYVAGKCAHGDSRLSWSVPGPAGPAGPSGPRGAQGGTGSTGLTGTTAQLPAALPSGDTEDGVYGLIGVAGKSHERPGQAISFKLAPPNPPTVELVGIGGKSTSNCPGSATAPKAKAGYLCIYEAVSINIELFGWENPITGETGGEVPRFGFEMAGFAKAVGTYNATGSWALTAS